MATVPPFLRSILAEATRIAPNRSTASDGTVGDRAHRARISDHNPDSRGIVHACDVTHDPRRGFDAHAHGEIIRAKCAVGTERRVKYLVSHNFAQRTDVIASPKTGWRWARKADLSHASHLHISILYETWVERSTAPIFGSGVVAGPSPVPQEIIVPVLAGGLEDEEDYLMIEQPGKSRDPNRTATHRLDRAGRFIISYNLGALGGDQEFFAGKVTPRIRWLREIPKDQPIVGWFSRRDGRGVTVQGQLPDGMLADYHYDFT